MSEKERTWWIGFYVGMVWSGLGISIINLVLLLGVVFSSTQYNEAMITTSVAAAAILISSAVMTFVVCKKK